MCFDGIRVLRIDNSVDQLSQTKFYMQEVIGFCRSVVKAGSTPLHGCPSGKLSFVNRAKAKEAPYRVYCEAVRGSS